MAVEMVLNVKKCRKTFLGTVQRFITNYIVTLKKTMANVYSYRYGTFLTTGVFQDLGLHHVFGHG